MQGPVFIVGPTSVGKSALALELARRCDGEIVNADAFQIYEGLSLLTSKPSRESFAGVRHHLFGTVALSETYNVARYREEATACIDDIRRRDRLAIVVGGTGLYVKALTHGLSSLPAADLVLRRRLDAMDLTDLQAELQRIDPVAMRQVDLKNKRRVIRAVEVSLVTGTPFSSHRDAWNETIYGRGEAGLFLDRQRDELRTRIDQQVEAMFDAGVVDEVRHVDPARIGATAATIIGLNEIRQLLARQLPLSECKERIKIRTRQYAKRQITWFKKELVFRRLMLPGESMGADESFDALLSPPESEYQSKIFPAC